MNVIVKINLDKYPLSTIGKLLIDGIVSKSEVMTHKDLKSLSDYEKLLWFRKVTKQ